MIMIYLWLSTSSSDPGSLLEGFGCDVYPIPSQIIVVRPGSLSWTVNFAPVICSATQIAVLDGGHGSDHLELKQIYVHSLSMEGEGQSCLHRRPPLR